MNDKKMLTYFVAVLGSSMAVLLFLASCSKDPALLEGLSDNPSLTSTTKDSKADKRPDKSVDKPREGAEQPQSNKIATTPEQSLMLMAQTMAYYAHPSQTLKGLLEYLKDSGQEPKAMRDANDQIGNMYVVRTESPLPGTRYFHAEYFSDDDNDEPFPSHLSFEYQPGQKSMAEAIRAVETAFTHRGSRTYDREDFVQWDLYDGYVVWIKKMDEYDITNHPYNAYEPSDVGTIKVTIEIDPHHD